jgi:hypothetical protein
MAGVLQAQKDRDGDDGSERQAGEMGEKGRKMINQMSSYHAILHVLLAEFEMTLAFSTRSLGFRKL